MNDNKRKLYDALSSEYELGSFEQFSADVADDEKRKKLYDATSGEYDYGDYDSFSAQLGFPKVQEVSTIGNVDILSEQAPETVQAVTPTPEQEPSNSLRGFKAGAKESWKGLKAGTRFAFGELANMVTGSSDQDANALYKLDEMLREGKDVSKEVEGAWSDAGRELRTGALEFLPGWMIKGWKDKIQTEADKQRVLDDIRDVLGETGGDVAKARQLLAERAEDKTFGDIQKTKAAEEFAQVLPTEGFGAWLGSNTIQMIPSASALIVGALTKSPTAARAIGMIGMGGMTAATAGSSMYEAREAGASDLETRKVGVIDGAIEYITERLPFDTYTNWMVGKAKSKVSTDIAKALRSNSPIKNELEDLLVVANKELGGKLFSKKNLTQYIADMAEEGLSEFSAEASQTMTKLIYEDEEKWPLLKEAVGNGMQGMLAGLFMGAVLGGASITMEHNQNKDRRKSQGYVDVGVVNFGTAENPENEVVEVLSVDDDTQRAQVLRNGAIENVNKDAIGQSYRFSYNAFEAARMRVLESEALDNKTVTEGQIKAASDRVTAAGNTLVDALKASGRSDEEIANIMDEANIDKKTIHEDEDVAAAYDAYLDARERERAVFKTFNAQKEFDRTLKKEEIQEAAGQDFWREIPTEKDGVTTWELIVTHAQLQDGRTVYLFPGIDATETAGVTVDGEKVFVTPDMIVEGSEVTEDLDTYLDNLVAGDKAAKEQARMSEQTQDRLAEARAAAQPGTDVNVGTVEEPINAKVINQTPEGVIVESEAGVSQLSWDEYANAMNIGSPVLTDEETASFEAAEILGAESAYQAEQVTVPSEIEDAAEQTTAAVEEEKAAEPLPTKKDGSVDQTTLWNQNPRRWAEWNDEQRQDGGANSLAYITNALAKEQKKLDELNKAYNAESDFDVRATIEKNIVATNGRIAQLTELQQKYAPAEAEEVDTMEQRVRNTLAELYADDSLSDQEIDEYIAANVAGSQSDLDKHLNKAPKMGRDMAQYKEARAKFEEKTKEMEAERDFWKSVQEYTTVPETEMDMEPQNALEFAAKELSSKNGIKLQKDSFRKYTGYRGELGGFRSLFKTKENGGLTMEEAGERLMEMDREYNLGFFDQNDPNAGLNTLLDLLQSAEKYGDISRYIKNARKEVRQQEIAAARSAMMNDLSASAETTEETEDVGDIPDDIWEGFVEVTTSLDEDMPDFDTRLRTEQSNAGSTRYANVKERAKAWEKRLGVKVKVIEDVNEVTDAVARDAIKRGAKATGWFDPNTGEVCIYAPNITSVAEIDKTAIHEVISHKGLRGLLGKKGFNALCNSVWKAMTPEARAKYLQYENVLSKKRMAEYLANPEAFVPTEAEQRAAADEFIARYSESVNVDKNAWQKMIDSAKRFINKLTGKYTLGDQLDELIESSLARYEQIAKMELKGVVEEGVTYRGVIDTETGAMINPSANEQAEGNTALRAKDGMLVGMHNISEDKLRKAIKQGGLANPSTAVVNIAEYSLEGYGDISLIMPSSLVDSETGDNAGTYTGDAWTPTYPTISRQIDDAGWKIVKDRIRAAVGESDDLYHDIVNSVDNYLSDDRNSRLEFVFLKEKGIEPKIELKGADGYVGLRNLEAILGVEGLRDSMESYEKYKAASPMAKRSFNMWQRVGGEKKAHKALKDEIRQYPQFAKLMGLDEDLTFAGFDSFTYSIFRKEYDAGNVNTIDTLGGASRYVDANDMRTEFDAWLESLMEEAGAKEVFFAGWTRDGDRIYKDNTLENVSRHMRMQGRTNAYNDHGLSATKSALLQRLRSLAEIRKNRARLQDESSYNRAYDKIKDRLFSVISQLADMEKISDNPFMNIDYAEARLQEAIVKRNPISYLNNEYGYGIDPKGEYAEELKSFIKDVQKMPAKYFETKFERPVYLNEFAAAVMPNNTSEDVKQAITEAGLPIFEYDSAVEGARREATLKATEEEGVRFRILGEMGAANLGAAEEATIRLDNLDVARQMEEAGKDAKTIKLATGWERGVDNLWRYEVPDEYNLADLEKRLQEELDNGAAKTWGIVYPSDLGQLLKEYPDFNVDIMVWVGDEFENTGAYSPATEGDENTFGRSASIEVEAKTIADVAPLLAHEIQHAIQEMEGFAEGGQARGLNDKLSAELDKRVATIKQLREEGRNEEADELMQMSKGLAEAVINNDDDAYGNYKKLAGEVEARNAATRIGKSLQERRETLLSETEDVAREDQIILMEGLGVSEMGHKTDVKMGEIGKHYADKTLDATQKTIVDTYSGALDNNKIIIKDKTGVERSIVMRQGNEKNFGTKHSLFRHYGTNTGVINADDIALIPKVLEEGKRTEKVNKKVDYVLKIGKVTYTVYTRKDGNGEVFYDFYSSWRIKNKAESSMPTFTSKGGNTQLSARTKDASALSADKGSNNLGESNTRFRITPEQDKAYMDAVKVGDMETAQRMVIEAAKLAMPNTKVPGIVYHGTRSTDGEQPYNTITAGHFTDDYGFAEFYANAAGEGFVYNTFLNIEQPLVYDFKGQNSDNAVDENGERITTFSVIERARKEGGYDGVILKNVDEYGSGVEEEDGEYPGTITDIIPLSPSQIKSADPVTYDNDGNVIPLSERFNPENEDIRFRMSNENQAIFVSNAAKAVEGIKQEKATPEQWLKMIEKNGGLKAGEDKWMGLSDWLKASDKKTLTKAEVLDFINENMIVIEEAHYTADAEDDAASRHDLLEQTVNGRYKEILKSLQDIEDYDERRFKAFDLFQEELGKFADLVELDWSGAYLAFPYEDLADYVEFADMFGVDIKLDNPIHDTRLAYTTPGLYDHREIALTVPTIESWNESDDLRFGDAGEGRAVAWIRFGETKKLLGTVEVEGKKKFNWAKVLVIDEIQSKRHQEGREKGYTDAELIKMYNELSDLNLKSTKTLEEHYRAHELSEKIHEMLGEQYHVMSKDIDIKDGEYTYDAVVYGREYSVGKRTVSSIDEAKEYISRLANNDISAHNREMRKQLYNGVPDAPFDKNWHELAMKRMLRYAAENGYDVVAWTKGEQQAERYNIGSYVSSIEAQEEYDGNRDFGFYMGESDEALTVTVDENGTVVSAEDHLSQAVGRPLADLVGKEMAVKMMQMKEYDVLEDTDLKVGNEGMKGFYDKMLPAFMNKYGKKWGVKVEDINLPGLANGLTMHSVPVTEEMKASVMEGQVMFRVTDESVEVYEGALSEYKSKYNEVAPMSVVDIRSMQSLADALGVSVKELGWLRYFTTRLAVLRGMKGAYAPEYDRIVIFANNSDMDRGSIENKIFHENVHKVTKDNSQLLELGKWMWDNLDTITANYAREAIKKDYDEAEYADEMVSSVVSTYMSIGKTQHFLGYLPDEHKANVELIFNTIGYESDREDRERDLRRQQRDDRGLVQEQSAGRQMEKESVENQQDTGTSFRIGITPEVRDEMDAIKASAIVMGNFMKAPNGKDTNLTEEQWALVRTKNFINWFGDWINDPENASKVVDENDEPMVVFHGTPNEFWQFKKAAIGSTNDSGFWGEGFYFTPQEALAYHYAQGGRILPVFLSIRNPYDIQFFTQEFYDHIERFGMFGDKDFSSSRLTSELTNEGKDGVVVRRGPDERDAEYVAFDPSQIKSAADNTGEFSKKNDDIRFKVVTDPAKIEELEDGPKVEAYRAVQIDKNGRIYSPMASRLKSTKKGTKQATNEAAQMNQWDQAVESLDKVDENGKITILDEDGGTTKVSYNPYGHCCVNSMMNDQFKRAWERDGLYVMKVLAPESELTAGYHAEKAKDAVGIHKWKTGAVGNKLPENKRREILLTRWMKNVKVMPWEEVAQDWIKTLEGENVDVPFNVVPRKILNMLAEAGVKIVAPEKGMENAAKAYEQWLADPKGYVGNTELPDHVKALNEETDDDGPDNEPRFRTTGTPTEDVVAEGVSLSPAQLASLAGDIFAALPEESRKKITDTLNGNLLGLQDAIFQIPTSLAVKEEWNDEDKVIADVIAEQMTKAVGKEMTRPFSASEALWLLYNAVNKSTDLVSEASRALVKRNLGFGPETLEKLERAKDDVRFRTVGDASDNARASLYNKEATNVWSRLKETFIDMNASVEGLIKAIERQSGKVVKGFENILLALNQQSSKGLKAMKAYESQFLQPMLDEVKRIMEVTGRTYDDVVRYVILKHGLERNEAFAKRDAREYYRAEFGKKVAAIESNASLSDVEKMSKKAEAQKEFDAHMADIDASIDAKYREFKEKDYSGLTSMFYDQLGVNRKDYQTEEEYQAALMDAKRDKYDTIADVENAAEAEVLDFERMVNTDNLWAKINASTKEILKQQYEANMISKDQYETLRDMFEYYVPLRGFKDNTAEDMYTYYRKPNSTGYTKPILAAEGRKTEAESPFGWIAAMASSAIASNVKNEAKLALYYFVSNRPDNGIATISKTWFMDSGELDADGKKIFKPVYPSFTEGLSTDAAKAAYEAWQENMRQLRDKGQAYESGQKLSLGNAVVNISDAHKPEHIVTVKVGGKDYTIVINGNPRAAQAINGDLNIETVGDYSKLFGPALRWMSSVNTSYNPEFWFTNLQRDMLFTLMNVSTKDPAFREAFGKNYMKAFKVISMIRKDEKGTLGSSYLENLYKEFTKYGGVTGYTQIKDNEVWEKEIAKYMDSKDAEQRKIGRVISYMKRAFHAMHRFGEGLEQVSRFAAFIAARETGMDMNAAINEAKEITVNFNRKGSGKKISFEEAKYLTNKNGLPLNKFEQAAVVGLSSIAPLGRRFIMFFNASIQGLNSMAKLYRRNPSKMNAWLLGYAALGVMQALLHSMMDDEDEYLDIPEYERRNSLLLGGDGVYFKWALPQEARAAYALGDLAVESILGRNVHESIIGEALKIGSEVLPINPTEGARAFLPSAAIPFVELAVNEDYKGEPIFNEQKWLSEEEKKHTPKWESAYKGTGVVYVGLAKLLNNVTDGKDADQAGLANLQPEKIEHIVQSAFGGPLRTMDKFFNMMTSAVDPEEEVTIKQTPFLNRFLTINDERFRNAYVNDVYEYYEGEAKNVASLIKKYQKAKDAESLRELKTKDEYQWARIYNKYKKPIKNIQEKIKVAEGTSEKMELMKQQDELKKMMIKEISEL